MPSFKPRARKTAGGGQVITIYRDSTGAGYVGTPQDPECHPMPMGAFQDLEAARRWADRRFPGGTWTGAREQERLPAGTHLPAVQET